MSEAESTARASAGHSPIAVLNDLIFATKIRSTGQALGVPIRVVASVAAMESALAKAPANLLILDLNFLGDQVAPAIAVARKQAIAPRIVAFVAHVDQGLASQAAQAGADEVMRRSRFVQVLPALLGDSTTGT